MQINFNGWDFADKATIVISLLTFTASLYTAWKIRKHTRSVREAARSTPAINDFPQLVEISKGVNSTNPVAVAVSLIPNQRSINKLVKEYLVSEQMEMPIRELNMDGINGTPDLESLINRLRELRRTIDEEGFTEVHLFLSSPVQAATVIGASLSRWLPVKLYHKNNLTNCYEYWMPLVK